MERAPPLGMRITENTRNANRGSSPPELNREIMKTLTKVLIWLIVIEVTFILGMKATEGMNTVTYTAPIKQEDLIETFSKKFGADPKIVKAVVRCESGGDHKTIGDGGHSKGVLQFQEETFYRMADKFGEDLDYTSKYDQIKLGTWALAQEEYASEWTTYVAITHGGKYSFYSRQNKRHYTIYCKA